MTRPLLAFSLLLIAGLLTVIMSIYKRKAILDLGTIGFFTNWRLILILGIMAVVFLLNIAVFAILPVNHIAIINWSLTVPFFLLTIFLSHHFLGESIRQDQHLGIALMILSSIIALGGLYAYYR